LIEEQDKITHDLSLEDDLELEENLNFFKFDPDYQMKENQWDEIKKEILGEYADIMMKSRQQEEEDENNPESLEQAGANAAGVPIDPNSINYQKVSVVQISFLSSYPAA